MISFSAFLFILSFPNFVIPKFSLLPGFIAWFALIPFIYNLCNTKNTKKAFLKGFLWGIISFTGILYWLSFTSPLGAFAPFALLLISSYIALYYGIFALIFVWIKNHTKEGSLFILFICSLWVSLEYIRGTIFTGFPWGTLGYSQYMNYPILQLSAITGVYGISFIIVLVNCIIVHIIQDRKLDNIKIPLYLLAIVFLIIIIINHKSENNNRPLKIALLQGNIKQENKWKNTNKEDIYNIYKNLALKSAEQKAKLIIWPETSFPSFLLQEPEDLKSIKQLVSKTNAYHIVGTLNINSKRQIFNSAVVFKPNGKVQESYSKIHLVPFGEFIPLKNLIIAPFEKIIIKCKKLLKSKKYTTLFNGLPNFSKGKEYNVVKTYFGKLSILICYEVIFPNEVKRFIKNGADILVNITNDGWYGKTAASYQHASMIPFRAVENRCFILRAANTGVSCIVTPFGKIKDILHIYKRGTVISDVNTKKLNHKTLYFLFGNFICWISIIFCGYYAIKILMQ